MSKMSAFRANGIDVDSSEAGRLLGLLITLVFLKGGFSKFDEAQRG